LDRELTARKENSLKVRIKQAGFPEITTLEAFDWAFNPDIDEKKIRALAELSFVDENGIALFLGKPGTGKSHIALAIGIIAATKGHRVFWTSCLILILNNGGGGNHLPRTKRAASACLGTAPTYCISVIICGTIYSSVRFDVATTLLLPGRETIRPGTSISTVMGD
jgi:hypothetical protein